MALCSSYINFFLFWFNLTFACNTFWQGSWTSRGIIETCEKINRTWCFFIADAVTHLHLCVCLLVIIVSFVLFAVITRGRFFRDNEWVVLSFDVATHEKTLLDLSVLQSSLVLNPIWSLIKLSVSKKLELINRRCRMRHRNFSNWKNQGGKAWLKPSLTRINLPTLFWNLHLPAWRS